MALEDLQIGAVRVLAPEGRLDSDNTPEFELALHDHFAEGQRHFVIDFAKLNYISSRGAESVVLFRDKLNAAKGSLRLCAIPPTVKQILQMSGFGFGLDVYRSRDDALFDHPADGAHTEAIVALAGQLLGAPEDIMGGIPDAQSSETARSAAKLLGAKPEKQAKPPAKATAFQAPVNAPVYLSKNQPPAVVSATPAATKDVATKQSLWERIQSLFGRKPKA